MNAQRILFRIVIMCLLTVPQVVSAVSIDQSYDAQAAGSYMGINIEATQEIAQTFTVGIPGPLVGVDLQVGKWDFDLPTEDLLVDIRPTTGGVPVPDDSLALASIAIPVTDIPLLSQVWATGTFTFVDLSGFSITVTPGEMLAIALHTTSPTGFYGWVDQIEFLGPTYPGGAQYSRRFSPDWGETVGWDAGFRTYVAPEPATLTMMCIGLVGIAFGKHRKRPY